MGSLGGPSMGHMENVIISACAGGGWGGGWRLRAASHYTISVVRRIRLDAICHDGSSQVIVAND